MILAGATVQAYRAGARRGVRIPYSQTLGRIGVWPSEVDDYKRRLDVQWKTTDPAVRACAKLTPETRAAWTAELAVWSGWAQKSTDTFGAGHAWDVTEDFERRLRDWQDQVTQAGCPLSSPAVKPPEEPSDYTGLAKLVAGAVITGAVVYALSPFIAAAAEALKRKR